MKKIMLTVLVLFLMAAPAAAKDFEVTKKAGSYSVVARFDRNPPIVGDNNLSVSIKDAKGAEVKDARVTVEQSMAAMPGMPAVRYRTDMALKGSEYKAKLNFSTAGGWGIAVMIDQGGKKAQAKFNINVR